MHAARFVGALNLLKVLRGDYEHKAAESCVDIAWLILHILRAILYVEASHQISKEVDIIRHQVGELSLLVTSVGQKIPLEVDIFQLVVLENYPETIPMGFFTVSRTLLGPVLGVVLKLRVVNPWLCCCQ
ncbi:unnamed protein product [Pieris macdunnoughi]|uniref:Uncharacterized protein n=1 Tax=Pieris macdunnoughi TaxID=345717 RepID=A0A821QVC3_9NEOP|nr:unnamed protein product [Pieris macdunnoughi]